MVCVKTSFLPEQDGPCYTLERSSLTPVVPNGEKAFSKALGAGDGMRGCGILDLVCCAWIFPPKAFAREVQSPVVDL